MKSLNINDIKVSTIGFSAKKIIGAKSVWASPEFRVDGRNALDCLSETFSYAVPKNECFSGINFSEEQRVFQAERYGGQGVGENGGGVRCGNAHGYQIKGIGQNPLVGPEKKKWHSYGGLNARDAVYEAIYAQVLNYVLPVGAANVYGVIFTAPDGAYYEYDEADPGKEEKGWGALLIREICLRPGHFIRSALYKPRKDFGVIIPSDVVRVRQVNKSFYGQLGNINEIIKFLGKFLQNCSNQFAFAKVARITHGGICPSNLCFDGRWIDLTNTSFIGGGENIGGLPPFYEEPFAIGNILKEFVDTFAKYNNIDLNIPPLINYYNEQLESYFNYYLCGLFGLTYDHIHDSVKGAEYSTLVMQSSLILNAGRKVINEWPASIKDNDPVVVLQEGLFLSLVDSSRSIEELQKLSGIKNFNIQSIVTSFSKTFNSCFEFLQDSTKNYKFFIKLCLIKSLKRSFFSEYFYKGKLLARIKLLLDAAPFESKSIINNSIDVSKWIFEDIAADSVTLFEGNGLFLSFDGISGGYRVRNELSSEVFVILSEKDFLGYLYALPETVFLIQGYSFLPKLTRIITSLAFIENCTE